MARYKLFCKLSLILFGKFKFCLYICITKQKNKPKMNATKFNPGTIFSHDGITYMVIKKTSIPADNRFKAVWVTRMPESAPAAEKWDGSPDGWFALSELNDWRRRGVIYNIINPKC